MPSKNTLPITSSLGNSNNNPEQAKEKWKKIAGIFFDYDKSGRKRIGRPLRPAYWREAYNLGECEKIASKWHIVWKESETTLSFIKWCKIMGLTHDQETTSSEECSNTTHSMAYYNTQERQSLQVNLHEGKCWDTNNLLLGTLNDQSSEQSRIIVMSLDEKLYSYASPSAIHKIGVKKHSGILSGKPVLFAGEMHVKNGFITQVAVASGHYQPTIKQLLDFLAVLKKNDIDLSDIRLIDHFGEKLSDHAENYLIENLSIVPQMF